MSSGDSALFSLRDVYLNITLLQAFGNGEDGSLSCVFSELKVRGQVYILSFSSSLYTR
jgi:hypothetical protein